MSLVVLRQLLFRSALRICPLLLGAVLFAACAAPKETVPTEEEDFFAMIPAVDLSDEVVYSPAGDMKARLPQDWVTLDDARFQDPEIFAVACDPHYTMTIVFSEVPLDDVLVNIFRSKGMVGLLQANFKERVERLGGVPPKLLKAEEFALGQRKFGAYTFTTDSSLTSTRVALFYTRKHLYECTITQLPYTEGELPTNEKIKDVHQIVLGGIEW